MKRLLSIALAMLVCACLGAQTKEARQWMKGKEWLSGYKQAKPHKTINQEEFYSQYKKNRKQWDTLFAWLNTTDLTSLPKGKHPIEGSTLVASVEDSENAPLEKRNTESHRKKIDFQLVVSGTEGFALLDHESSTVKQPYDEKKDVMRYDYDPAKTHFFDVKGGHFVIFFPSDWHIAKVKTKKKDQTIRVVVVKMDYVE